MQISHRITGNCFGWPVAWAISLVSASAGAVACCGLWAFCRERNSLPWTFPLLMVSGFQLLFYGHIEVYAVPTCLLVFLILAFLKIENGKWLPSTLLLLWSALLWCHLMALVFLPVMMLAAWQHGSRLFRGKMGLAGWLLPILLFFITDIIQIGHGPGLKDLVISWVAQQDRGDMGLSIERLFWMKSGFFWLAAPISFPLAVLSVAWNWKDPFIRSLSLLSLCTLVFFVFFHPDAVEMDWDLFLLPSLPLAILGAEVVSVSRLRTILMAGWAAAFLSVWLPRVPIQADLLNRGLGDVVLMEAPRNGKLQLDGRYEITGGKFRVQGGFHTLAVRTPGHRIRWKVFSIKPGEQLTLHLPVATVPIGQSGSHQNPEHVSPLKPPGESPK